MDAPTQAAYFHITAQEFRNDVALVVGDIGHRNQRIDFRTRVLAIG